MPSDITGTTVLDETETGQRNFRFVEGPVFTKVLLADSSRKPIKDVKVGDKVDTTDPATGTTGEQPGHDFAPQPGHRPGRPEGAHGRRQDPYPAHHGAPPFRNDSPGA